jgi:hypothetical protein
LFLEHHLFAGTLAAWLFTGLLWPADDYALAEGIKSANQNLAEAVAVCNQQRDRSNSPHNAEHGEKCPGQIALQRHPGLANNFNQHKEIESLNHSVIESLDRRRECS